MNVYPSELAGIRQRWVAARELRRLALDKIERLQPDASLEALEESVHDETLANEAMLMAARERLEFRTGATALYEGGIIADGKRWLGVRW
jgi:hypothetical protein